MVDKRQISKYASQNIDEKDISFVVETLKGDFITQGNTVTNFEASLKKFLKLKFDSYAVCVSSGTAALHLAYLSLGVNPNSIIWVPCVSFVATANSGLYCGAKIEFVECSEEDGMIDFDYLGQKLSEAELNGCLPDVLVTVSIGGLTRDLDKLIELKNKYQFKILEDACHSFGGIYENGKLVGSDETIDVCVFSFHAIKNVTTGEGGAVICRSTEARDTLIMLRSHGIEKLQIDVSGFLYSQKLLGYNYRITDFQAALGVTQLEKLKTFINHKKKLAETYVNKLTPLFVEGKLLTLPEYNDVKRSAWHLFRLRFGDDLKNKGLLIKEFKRHGIGYSFHYHPIPRNQFWSEMCVNTEFPQSDKYYSSTLSIPMHSSLKVTDVEYISDTILRTFQ